MEFFPPSNAGHADTDGSKSSTFFSGRRTPLVLALAVFFLSLIANFGLWKYARQQAEQALQTDFDFQVRQSTKRIEARMATYEQVARGTQAFLLGSINVTREDFRLFVESLRLQEKFPGIQGLAFVQVVPKDLLSRHTQELRREGFPAYTVHPPGDRDIYSSIIQIEPFTGINLRAFGFDMLTSPVRRAAMEQARDTGQAAASGKVKLIQENGQMDQSGLVMYLPVYKRGRPTATVEERRANIIAWIGAPFRMDDLMDGLGGERSGDIILSIYDGENISDDARLYHSAEQQVQSGFHNSLFQAKSRIMVGGRPWTIDLQSSPSYEQRLDTDKALFIAVAGAGASAMLALLVWALASGRRRALALAYSMTHQLRESEFRWKYALEGAGDGVWDWNNASGEILYSKRWKEMLGYSESDIKNDVAEWNALLHPDDKPHALAVGTAFLNGSQETYSTEYRMRCKDGSWKWIQVRGAAVNRDAQGKVLRAIGTHSDITPRKDAERLEAEKTRALNDAREALQHGQKLEAVGKLTGGVAHDFNNVLQIISGNIQLLQYFHTGSPETEKRLNNMLAAVDRGSKLSSQLLAFARRQPLQPVVLNLVRIVENMDDLLQRALGESIELQVTAEEGLWNTLVDPSQLENVILNLTINARDAMPNGGRLTIELSNVTLDEEYVRTQPELQLGDYVLIAMSDNGVGMNAEVMGQAFEPFFTTKPAGEGTGLGLSMAYGFVKQSGGHIQLQSEPGHGTTIKIYLPRSLQVQAPVSLQVNEAVLGGDETILVVEDDEEVKTTVAGMLKELGYQVLTAENGERAFDMIKNGARMDLLFTDVVMPGSLSSPQLAKEAKRMLPNLAVLFTSGYTRNALISGGRLEEGVQLLSKPYRREQLAQKIRQVLFQQASVVNT